MGFGTAGADWVALDGDVQVGAYRGEARRGDIYGDPWFGSVTSWKTWVRRQAEQA